MADDEKISALSETTAPLLTDETCIVKDPGGTPISYRVSLATLQAILSIKSVADGRLTLASGVPVTTTDQANKTTLYYTPYRGNKIGLYDGVSWHVRTFSEISLAVGAFTASKPYDIWVYDNAGTPALDSTVWTDGTTRATALAYQDGTLVKNGDATRRYVGTIYIDSGQKVQDTLTKRFVWNYYNRAARPFYQVDATSNWSLNSGTYIQANGAATNQIELICGVQEDALGVRFDVEISTLANGRAAWVGVGVNATNTITGVVGLAYAATAGDLEISVTSGLVHIPALGYSFYAAIMKSNAAVTITGGVQYLLSGVWVA